MEPTMYQVDKKAAGRNLIARGIVVGDWVRIVERNNQEKVLLLDSA